MTKAETAQSALAAMVDELGDLETELQPVKFKIARADALRRAIRAPYAGADPALSFQAPAADGSRLSGPPAMSRA